MANRRNLKQSIQAVTSEMLTEAYMLRYLVRSIDDEKFTKFSLAVVELNNEFLSRVNHPEPGMKARVYYKQLCADFDKKSQEILAELK